PNNPREVGVYAADLSGQEWSECSPYDGKTQSARTKRLIRIEAKLDATLQALGVAQADLDDLQARAPLDVAAFAAALAPLLAGKVSAEDLITALNSPEGQAALVKAANTAED